MRRDVLELDASLVVPAPRRRLDLGSAEGIRVLLTGGSVIDWHKASFGAFDDVDRLLRLHHLDPGDAFDRARLRYLFTEAVSYVEAFLQLRVPPELRDVADVRQVFLWASDTRGFRRMQVLSCMILKLMHVTQHLEAAELRQRTALSERNLLDLATRHLAVAADRMRRSGVPLVAFYGSRKTRTAVITKLLCKRDDVASQVFDKLRYRVVVPTHDDLLGALQWLVREVVPFHQGVPGQSHNNLLDPDRIRDGLPPHLRDSMQDVPAEDDPWSDGKTNEFSGTSYRMINLVADLPVRLPDEALPDGLQVDQGRTVHVTTELQLVDEATSATNEQGENAHELYKRRQHERVRRRLTRGQFVPD